MEIIEVIAAARLLKNKDFALLDNNEHFTYADLCKSIDRISHMFVELSLKEKDIIFVSTGDKRSLVELTIAAFRFGIGVVLIDNHAKPERIESVISSCSPTGIFIDNELAEQWQINHSKLVRIKKETVENGNFLGKIFSYRKRVPSIAEDQIYFPECLNKYDGLANQFPQKVDPDSIAYVMYTSGSTSDPKGVVITHKSLFSHLFTLKKVYGMDNSTRIMNLLNLFHADGIIQGPMLTLYCSATWICPFKLDTAQLDLIYLGIYKYRVTHLYVVPTLLAFFEKYHSGFEDSFQTNDFKFIISVAAYLEPKLWQTLSELFKVQIVNVYGLTETVAGGIFCGPEAESHKIGTIGKPVDCELRIVDEFGNFVNRGEKGELLLKGNNLMSGYYKNPQANVEVIKDSWLYTGDIALEDEVGFIKIVGRKKSMINSGGFRIQPEEIEEVLIKLPEVEECKVIGIPDEILIEKIVAFVKPASGSFDDELKYFKYFREHLEHEKVPHELFFIENFQRGISGKIQVDPLRKMVNEWHQNKKVKMESNLETIIQIAASVFKINTIEINENSTSSTLNGWDSMNNFILIRSLEDVFNIRFTTSEIMSIKSIHSIDLLVSKKILK